MYYCIPEVRLSERLQTLQNECDYSEFLEVANANPGSHVEVYMQPQNNSIVVFERFYVSFKGVVDGC